MKQLLSNIIIQIEKQQKKTEEKLISLNKDKEGNRDEIVYNLGIIKGLLSSLEIIDTEKFEQTKKEFEEKWKN